MHINNPPKNYWFNLPTRMLTCFALALPIGIHAQDDDESQVFELSPFVVETSGDRGYMSTNTTAGTALNTALRNLPMGIEVINREFLEDIQAADMREGLSYTPGIYMQQFENQTAANVGQSRDRSPSTGIAASEFNDAVIIRGYSVPNQQRMGFRMGTIVPAYGVALGGITDSANTERQEVVRGPQSLLYGINVLSGIVNILPRRPLSEPRTSISLSTGSNSYFRSVLDHTGPLVENLNFRVMGTYQGSDDWVDFRERRREYYVGQLDWKLGSKGNLFIEAQYMDSKVRGVGPRFFQDIGSTSSRDFANPYREHFTFGRDYFNDLRFTEPRYLTTAGGGFDVSFAQHIDSVYEKDDGEGGVNFWVPAGAEFVVRRPGQEYEFPDLGRFYNISGPDTYRHRKEFNFMANLTFSPFPGWDIEAGMLYADADDTEFNVRMQVFNDNMGRISAPTSASPDVFYTLNPEFDSTDPIGYGMSDVFILPRHETNVDDQMYPQRKTAVYYWYNRPTTAETWQFRYRLARTFETSWFNDRVDGLHTIAGSLQYTQDEVSFVTTSGNWLANNLYYTYRDGEPAAGVERMLAQDPLIFRSSVFDYEPIRYDPSLGPLAVLANPRTSGLSGISETADHIARSGWIDATLWYRGKSAVYHGRFLQDRLHVVLGLREDTYQVREKERLIVLDKDFETDRFQGSGDHILTDQFAGYGDQPYVWNPLLPDSLNAKVEENIERLRLEQPMGTIEKSFDGDETYSTRTFGVNYGVTRDLSAYILYSEGVFPNSGQRDGANQPFTAERSSNKELGIKFEFMDGRISGRLAVWEINRSNAIWGWTYAPSPRSWYGGPNARNDEFANTFSPRLVDRAVAGGVDGHDIRYGVAQQYVEEAFRQLGIDMPQEHLVRGYNMADFKDYGVSNTLVQPARDPERRGAQYNFFMIDYHAMQNANDASDGQNPLKLAMDLAMRDSENLQLGGIPIQYFGRADAGSDYAHNASGTTGGSVGFEEKGQGIDGQVFLTPIPNYQIILGYSYQKRSVNSFELVPGYAVDEFGNVGDTLYTTEYDIWVFMLGAENFEDPRNPATLQSGAIKGVDLSFVPRTHLSLWNKYTFTEGPLERLELGFGVNFFSKVTTSVPVSATEMQVNPFQTPPLPARLQGDFYIGYRIEGDRTRWRFSLNVYNAFKHTMGEDIATYTAGDGRIEQRRSRHFYDPRSYRVSVSVTF